MSPSSTPHTQAPSPRRDIPGLWGILVQAVCHLVILSLFVYAIQLYSSAQPLPDSTAETFKMVAWGDWMDRMHSWAKFWVIATGLAVFTLFTWRRHSITIKLIGAGPLVVAVTRLFWI